MNHRTGVLIASLLLVFPEFRTASAQGIVNPGFESPGGDGQTPSAWTVTKGKFIQDRLKHHAGTYSGKLDGASRDASAYQDVPIAPGAVHQLTGFWRNGDRTAEFDLVLAEVRWLEKPGGRELSQAAIQDSGSVVSEWTPFQISAGIPPASAGAARITLRSRFGVGAFDALSWGIVAAAAAANAAPPTPPAAPPSAPSPSAVAAPAESAIPTLAQVVGAVPGASAPAPAVSESPAESRVAAAAATLPDLSQMTLTNGSTPAPPAPSAATPVLAGSSYALVWADDLRSARRVAAAENKKILVFFTSGDAASRQLEASVFSVPAVGAAMAGVVAVKLVFEDNRNLAIALQVSQPGTVTVYDSKGEFLARIDAPTAEKVHSTLQSLSGR